MIQVVELLERKTKELEDRLEAAGAKIIQLMTNNPYEVSDATEDR